MNIWEPSGTKHPKMKGNLLVLPFRFFPPFFSFPALFETLWPLRVRNLTPPLIRQASRSYSARLTERNEGIIFLLLYFHQNLNNKFNFLPPLFNIFFPALERIPAYFFNKEERTNKQTKTFSSKLKTFFFYRKTKMTVVKILICPRWMSSIKHGCVFVYKHSFSLLKFGIKTLRLWL